MTEKSLLFLDIDGVLNSQRWLAGRDELEATHLLHREEKDLDPEACALLQEICDQSKCMIVISSTWRILHSLDQLRAILKARGVNAPIIGKTPELDWRSIEQKSGSATRAASAAVLSYLAENVENMIVSSADLSNSDKTDGFLKKTREL